MKLTTSTTKRPQISLTPLIDVVFILLIFFMLVTKMTKHQSFDIDLPQDEHQSEPRVKHDQRDITVAMTASGKLLYQEQLYSITTFNALMPSKKITSLTIHIYPKVTTQQFIDIKQQLIELGYKQIKEQVINDEIN